MSRRKALSSLLRGVGKGIVSPCPDRKKFYV
jgi:hypothetical protein